MSNAATPTEGINYDHFTREDVQQFREQFEEHYSNIDAPVTIRRWVDTETGQHFFGIDCKINGEVGHLAWWMKAVTSPDVNIINEVRSIMYEGLYHRELENYLKRKDNGDNQPGDRGDRRSDVEGD